jgi:hypothetical protein
MKNAVIAAGAGLGAGGAADFGGAETWQGVVIMTLVGLLVWVFKAIRADNSRREEAHDERHDRTLRTFTENSKEDRVTLSQGFDRLADKIDRLRD